MRAALLLALLAAPALAGQPPVTQEEAVDFHEKGRCQMAEAGKGITRPDGRGWIASSLPGWHTIKTGRMSMRLDMTPGFAYPIVAPHGEVEWCPDFAPPGRDKCGPVPQAFLYNAVTVR